MAFQLSPLDDVLGAVLAGVQPAKADIVPLSKALGAFAGQDVHAPDGLPRHAVALVGGYALSSDETQGASAHEPLPINPAVEVHPGWALPPGTNAIAPAHLIETSLGSHLVFGALAPGEGVRFAGHDLVAGARIITKGERVSVQHLAVLEALGLSTVAVCRPHLTISGEGAGHLWLSRMLEQAGAVITTPQAAHVQAPLHLQITLHDDLAPQIALQPGGCARLSGTDGLLILDCIATLDSVFAAFFAIILPALQHLTGASLRYHTLGLSSELRSAIGLSEIALFRVEPDGRAHPLICGQITLEALLEATHVAIVPPDLEGYAPRSSVQMVPMTAPF